jgi:hypothetical protein
MTVNTNGRKIGGYVQYHNPISIKKLKCSTRLYKRPIVLESTTERKTKLNVP